MIRSWLARRRAFADLVDSEAAAMIEREGAAGYYSARVIARLADGRGDREAARLWHQVARRVAARTGLEPGRSKIGRPESEW